jgi:hypothetical protein
MPLARARRGCPSFDQEEELWLGVSHRGPAFADDAERRECWLRHRAWMMARYATHGRRPAGWWMYEATVAFPPNGEGQEAILFEHNLLGEQEREQLVAQWRRHFDRAQKPGFSFCTGIFKPGAKYATWLEGAAAKRAHYEWAGIPKSLLAQWIEEQRRRSKAA